MNLFIDTIKNRYADFSGRATRREYWHFILIYTLAYFVLSVSDNLIGTYSKAASIGILSGAFTLAFCVPAMAVTIRRLHDSNHKGWWFLLGCIPFGGLALLYFFVIDGTKGENRYGPDKKDGPQPEPVSTPAETTEITPTENPQ